MTNAERPKKTKGLPSMAGLLLVILGLGAYLFLQYSGGSVPGQDPDTTLDPYDFSGKVVSVGDGDTIEVMRDGKAQRIRLHGVDSPELGQAFGRQAKEFTSDLVYRETVTVEEETVDQFGRVVGIVYLSDGRSLNEELLRSGYAWFFERYSNSATYDALQREARSERRGLWRDDNPEEPWDWRRNNPR